MHVHAVRSVSGRYEEQAAGMDKRELQARIESLEEGLEEAAAAAAGGAGTVRAPRVGDTCCFNERTSSAFYHVRRFGCRVVHTWYYGGGILNKTYGTHKNP